MTTHTDMLGQEVKLHDFIVCSESGPRSSLIFGVVEKLTPKQVKIKIIKPSRRRNFIYRYPSETVVTTKIDESIMVAMTGQAS